ncbi:single-stranded-DNA-specific exonuclease RecJ [Candidatus Dependentiae bacterium]|nr:single-stranded-DNA-specific exonuclease RecJ [Candidatus Dependentiae bacterium]
MNPQKTVYVGEPIKDISEKFEIFRGLKYLWRLKKTDHNLIKKVAYDYNLSFPISHVLASRGFIQKGQIDSFLFSSYEKDVFSPLLFKDLDLALSRINAAIDKKEKILIFGDYDVDGITSTALLLIALKPLGANINFYLPNRKKDGYGLSEKIVKQAYQNGYKLIITVDNGISAINSAQLAYKLKVDLIITDHHRPQDKLPHAVAIVDANQKDCTYPYKDLAGVGVIFKLVSIIYQQRNLTLPEKVYELLMLGTVADVAPLLGENRYWVRYGLGKINKKRSLAIKVLAKNSNLNKKILDSLDIGFMIAPQLNALGRLDDPRDAVRFLVSSNTCEIEKIGDILKNINETRKMLERKIFEDIEFAIFEKNINLETENVIVAANSQWPVGIIGLVAGKLMHNYGKPTLLFHLNKDGVLKGSCRSILEFNIFDALNENKELLINFGGHSFAAGLKLKKENLPKLKERLEHKIVRELAPEDLIPKIELDAEIDLSELKLNLLNDLCRLEPFGNKNEQPVFIIKNVTLLKAPMLLRERHVKCVVFSQGVIKPVIFFNRPDLYPILNNIGDKTFNIAAYISKSEWNEKINIELQGLDIATQ